MVKGYMDALPQYSQVGIPAECIEKISEYVNSWELAALRKICDRWGADLRQHPGV